LTRYLRFLALPIVSLSILFMGLFPVAAAAQQVTQQDINNNLCSGASIDLSGASSSTCNGVDATNSISNLVQSLINLLSLVVGVVAVIMIIVGGLRYITSGGNDSSVTGAKNTILYAVIGLVIVALSQIIVRFVLSKIATS
jgi:hypothetical protein